MSARLDSHFIGYENSIYTKYISIGGFSYSNGENGLSIHIFQTDVYKKIYIVPYSPDNNNKYVLHVFTDDDLINCYYGGIELDYVIDISKKIIIDLEEYISNIVKPYIKGYVQLSLF